MISDSMTSLVILALVGVALLGPMAWLLLRQLRRTIAAFRALRDRLDRSQRH